MRENRVNKVLFYKKVDGKRVPHALILDEQRNYVDIMEMPHTNQPGVEDRVEELKARGYEVATTSGGGIRVTGLSPELRKAMDFFSDKIDCWFDGCEELRENYKEDLKALKADGKCKGCDKGALIRKYQDLIREAMKDGS